MPKPSKYYAYIARFEKFFTERGYVPSFNEALSVLNVRSNSVVWRFYQQLVAEGILHKDGNHYRADTGRVASLTSVPLFESIQAGFPNAVKNASRQEINLEDYLIERPETTMLIKVTGDSMRDAGIMDGDIIIVNSSTPAKPNDIVVAEVDGEFTLKYLAKDAKGTLYLQPANPDFAPIYPEGELAVRGVVTGSFRKYDI